MSEGQDLNAVLNTLATELQAVKMEQASTKVELTETKRQLAVVRPEPARPPPPPIIPLTEADDIESYLSIFERTATQDQWPRAEWASILAPYLKGPAQRAYHDLPKEVATQYDLLSPEIYQRYGVTTGQQARVWRHWRFDPELPARDQAFEYWGKLGCWLWTDKNQARQMVEQVASGPERQLVVTHFGGSEKPARGTWQGHVATPEPTRCVAETPARLDARATELFQVCMAGRIAESAHPLARHTNVTSPAHSPLPEKHLKTHSPEHTHSTQDFQCTFCSKSFQVQRYLNAHLKKQNTKRIMQCEHCQQCFKTTCALKKHLRTHSTVTFNCTFCKEDFTGEMDLHNHMQIHSIQRFVCKICNKHFHERKYLTNHLKTHSLMNSFQCRHCSKTFTRQKSLKAHLNTHSTEQTHSKQIFQCTICSKTFRVQRYLNMHLKTPRNTCSERARKSERHTHTHRRARARERALDT
uniref:C2H2-type domain-containing protein n=1 Tax=Erpetoichthys calabaricus TaxID=27687 RepID=A0A8C4X456_ERPCA